MKSLKTRGALIVEYALLLAVCCILGVIYLDAAPGVRDGVGDIKTKTEKVLADANDKIKGDKPGEDQQVPNYPENIDDFGSIVPMFSDSNGNPRNENVNAIGKKIFDCAVTDVRNLQGDYQNALNGGREKDITMVSWENRNNANYVSLTFKDGTKIENAPISSNGELTKWEKDWNIGSSGTIVINQNSENQSFNVLQHNSNNDYSYFEVSGKPVGWRP